MVSVFVQWNKKDQTGMLCGTLVCYEAAGDSSRYAFGKMSSWVSTVHVQLAEQEMFVVVATQSVFSFGRKAGVHVFFS